METTKWCGDCEKNVSVEIIETADEVIEICGKCQLELSKRKKSEESQQSTLESQELKETESIEKDASVRVLVLDESDRALFVKNRAGQKTLPSGKSFFRPSRWGMPGGRRDPEDEDEVDTGTRETREEISLRVGINPELRVEEPAENHLEVAFIGYPIGGKLKICSEEIIDARWFPIRVLEDINLLRGFLNDRGAEMHRGHQRMALELLQLRRKP